MYKVKLFCFLLVNFFIFSAESFILECRPTPEIFIGYNLSIFDFKNKTNNLRRKTGSVIVEDKNPITIQGVILDQKCIPLTNALITVWHADSYGEYNFDNYEGFRGGGYAVTDNLGRFKIFTSMPGVVENNGVPFVNFIVNHKDFLELQVKMFFPENININNPSYRSVNENVNSLVVARFAGDKNDIKVYNFNIIFDSDNAYKKY